MAIEPAELDELAQQLAGIRDCSVLREERLAKYTSYGIGGPAALLVAPENDLALTQALALIRRSKLPLIILGHGSNILVADSGWPGVVLYFGRNFSEFHFAGETVRAQSGTSLMDLVKAGVARGLSGLELLAGIPGSVGGALRMNAGAFGQEIQNITETVFGVRTDGSPVELCREEISFGYRSAPELDSIVITGGRFRLTPEAPARLKTRMEEILAIRTNKQPLDYPSCGSVFKRPPGYYAGALIEGADLKGKRVGDAMVSAKHCGFIVNLGQATARQIYQLIRLVEERVWDRFGVRLEREVRLVGDFEDDGGYKGVGKQ